MGYLSFDKSQRYKCHLKGIHLNLQILEYFLFLMDFLTVLPLPERGGRTIEK